MAGALPTLFLYVLTASFFALLGRVVFVEDEPLLYVPYRRILPPFDFLTRRARLR